MLHNRPSCLYAAYHALIVIVILAPFLVTAAIQPIKELHFVCKRPQSNLCMKWNLTKYLAKHVNEPHDLSIDEKFHPMCGISKLIPISPHKKFIKVSLLTHGKGRYIFCKTSTIKNAGDFNSLAVEKAMVISRIRRQTSLSPRGRYRGQTQSQYLTIDHGNGQSEGKAEAQSAADSSRASVSGNSGMGQAQSQSIYDPNCEECNGNPKVEAQFLHRMPGQNHELSGPIGSFPGHNKATSGGYQSGNNGNKENFIPNQYGYDGKNPNSGVNRENYTPSVQGNPTIGGYFDNIPTQEVQGVGPGIGRQPGQVNNIDRLNPNGGINSVPGYSTNTGVPGDYVNDPTNVNQRPTGNNNGNTNSGYNPSNNNAQGVPHSNNFGNNRKEYPNQAGLNHRGNISPAMPTLDKIATQGLVPNQGSGNYQGGLGDKEQEPNLNPKLGVPNWPFLSGTFPDGSYYCCLVSPQKPQFSGSGNFGTDQTKGGNELVPGYGHHYYQVPYTGSNNFPGIGSGQEYPDTSNIQFSGTNAPNNLLSPSTPIYIGNTRTGTYPYSNQYPDNTGVASGVPGQWNNQYPRNGYPESPQYRPTIPGTQSSRGPNGISNNQGNYGQYGGPVLQGGLSRPEGQTPSEHYGRPGINSEVQGPGGQSAGSGVQGGYQGPGKQLVGPGIQGPGGQNIRPSIQDHGVQGGYQGLGNHIGGPGLQGSGGQILRPGIQSSGAEVGRPGVQGVYQGPGGLIGVPELQGTGGQIGGSYNQGPGGQILGPSVQGYHGPGDQIIRPEMQGPGGQIGRPGGSGLQGGYQTPGGQIGGLGLQSPGGQIGGSGIQGSGGQIGGTEGQTGGLGIQTPAGQVGGTSVQGKYQGPGGQFEGPGLQVPGGTVIQSGYQGLGGQTGGPGIQDGYQGPGGQTGGPGIQGGIHGPGLHGPGGQIGGPSWEGGLQGQIGSPSSHGVPGLQTGTSGWQVGTEGQSRTPGLQSGIQGSIGQTTGPDTQGEFAEMPRGQQGPGGQIGPNLQGSVQTPGGLNHAGVYPGMSPTGTQGPGVWGQISPSNRPNYGTQEVSGAVPSQGGFIQPGGPNYPPRSGYGIQTGNGDESGAPQNVVDPNLISSSIDGDDSEAQASVSQADNGTIASASSKGGNDKGRAQTNVQGTYTGSGSFSAQAQISDDNKAAESEVSGGKQGASSKAQGSGKNNKSQASVQLGSETGSIQTQSQSDGKMHSSNSQVQGSVKGGMANSQARGPGITSSQAQIGFTPYKEGEKSHDLFKTPFVGSGTASAHSSGRTGQSQSQLHGIFKYGITYNGAAQAGASLDKDAVFPNRLNFEKLNVFDENEKNINIETAQPAVTAATNETTQSNENASQTIPDTPTRSQYSSHSHYDHHKPESKPPTLENATPEESKRSFHTTYGPNSSDYEYRTDKDDEYYPETGLGTEIDPEYTSYDDVESTHQALQSNSRKGLDVKQTTDGNSQHIVLGALKNQDAFITQRSSQRPDESKVYQPGEKVPGTGGYTIPIGFNGSVKSVASRDNTYVLGSKDSPSQAQTVSIRPGTGKIKYVYPPAHSKNVPFKDLRSLQDGKSDENRYVSVSKSVTRALDSKNNIQKQYSHTYYTKSSSCGYFTFTCTMVSGADGRKKVCRPKIPTNPDGTPMRC